jgi:phospholipid/cholesterol/gamma-HCH transport system permease protein
MATELGTVLTAIVVTVRVGSAITAKIGTMKVTEQVDALYMLGTDPVKYVAVPRF